MKKVLIALISILAIAIISSKLYYNSLLTKYNITSIYLLLDKTILVHKNSVTIGKNLFKSCDAHVNVETKDVDVYCKSGAVYTNSKIKSHSPGKRKWNIKSVYVENVVVNGKYRVHGLLKSNGTYIAVSTKYRGASLSYVVKYNNGMYVINHANYKTVDLHSVMVKDDEVNIGKFSLSNSMLSSKKFEYNNILIKSTNKITRISFPMSLSLSIDGTKLGYLTLESKSKLSYKLDTNCNNLTKIADDVRLKKVKFGGSYHLSFSYDNGKTHFSMRHSCFVKHLPKSIRSVLQYRSRNWVSITNISDYMIEAIIHHEDPGFMVNNGFSIGAIRNSIKYDLKHKAFKKGASTITMQLAKNLFLKKEKTIMRKYDEMLYTMILNNALTKRSIMEMYMNSVEFGPGIYGINKTALKMFDTTPANLTQDQSEYIARIHPNPKLFSRKYVKP